MTIHKKDLQILMVEMYKTINHLTSAYMWEFFIKNDVPYNLCSNKVSKIPSVNSQRYGISSLSFRGSLLWNAVSDEIKLATSKNNFRNTTVRWEEFQVPYLHIIVVLCSLFFTF